MLMGMTSGGIGSFIGTPSELALVRMSNDSKLPEKQKRNYKSVVDCVARIAREEGVAKLWTGAKVTVIRAMLLSACALAFTSEIKLRLTGTGIFGETGQIYGGVPLLFCATLVSSFIANVVSNPVSRPKNQSSRHTCALLICNSSVPSVRCCEVTHAKPTSWKGWNKAVRKYG